MRQVEATAQPTPADEPEAEFLRLKSVMRRTGLGRSTIYQLIAEKKFPSPVKLARRAVGWRRSDLDRWSEARPASLAH